MKTNKISQLIFIALIISMSEIAISQSELGIAQKFSDSIKLSKEISDELDEITGVNSGFVVLIDSINGQKKYLKHADIDLSRTIGPEAASEIRNIASVSITGVTGVEIQGVTFNACNYININGQIELLCKRNENHELRTLPDFSADISLLPAELAGKLEKAAEISNIGFLVLVDIVTGQAKLLKRENYVSLSASLPQSISGIVSGSAWNITTYKKNPCCYWTIIDGDMVRICKKYINC